MTRMGKSVTTRPRDFYVTAKCPKCGRFMNKEGGSWKCHNKKCKNA